MTDEPPEEPPAPPPEPEPEPRRYPSTIGGAFYIAILLAAAAGIMIAAFDDWRLGVRVISASLGSAAVLRLLLPERDAGMLAVRHRFIDVGLLAGVGLALYFLAGDIPELPTT